MGDTIVEVPAMAGDGSHPAAAGPAALSAALADAGCRPTVRRVWVPPFGGDAYAASVELGRRLVGEVHRIVARGERPLVLAGSCDVAPAMLAGIGDARAGVVWIDAHADFNTPESSVSGFWPGMTLAVVVGDCRQELWSALGWRPVAPEWVALIGARSLSPVEEARRLNASDIQVVRWRDGLPDDDVETALDLLRERVERVYLHLDLDALDPAVGSGVVDPPVPGGLSAEQLHDLLGHVCGRFAVAGVTIATYTPSNDDGSTLRVASSALQRLIGCSP